MPAWKTGMDAETTTNKNTTATMRRPQGLQINEHALESQLHSGNRDISPLLPAKAGKSWEDDMSSLSARPSLTRIKEEPSTKIIAGLSMFNLLKMVVACGLYMFIGPALILLNKHIMTTEGFNYPMFLSGLGLAFSAVFSQFVVRCTSLVELQHREKVTMGFWMARLLPVGAGHALTLSWGNAVYLYLTVSFIQMLKAFTPCIVLIVVVIAGIERPHFKVVMSVLGICLGTFVASAGEVNLSPIGVTYMMLSEVTEAVRLVLTEYLLKNLRFGIIEGQYWLAPPGALCLFAGAAVMELPHMLENNAFHIMWARLPLFFLAATLGLSVQFLSFCVIQVASSVTLKVLGTARNAFLVLFSVYFFGELVTFTQFVGYSVSLLAFTFYNYFKIRTPN